MSAGKGDKPRYVEDMKRYDKNHLNIYPIQRINNKYYQEINGELIEVKKEVKKVWEKNKDC